MSIQFTVNGTPITTTSDDNTPLLWFLRDEMGLTGTKFGCGIAECGACTVHINGDAQRSCITPISTVEGAEVVTIEGVSAQAQSDHNIASDPKAHTIKAIQTEWAKLDVPQCGYCQSGQIMSAIALLTNTPTPTDSDIDEAMSGNICRCATYQRIRKAIHQAAKAAKRT